MDGVTNGSVTAVSAVIVVFVFPGCGGRGVTNSFDPVSGYSSYPSVRTRGLRFGRARMRCGISRLDRLRGGLWGARAPVIGPCPLCHGRFSFLVFFMVVSPIRTEVRW